MIDPPSLTSAISAEHAAALSQGPLPKAQPSSPGILRNQDVITYEALPAERLYAEPQTSAYLHREKSIEVTKEKAELLQRLFPKGISSSEFRQGEVGDCVLLASLKSAMHNNPIDIVRLINPKPNHMVEVAFNGRKPILLKENDFKKMGVEGDPGIQLLERAYGESLKSRKGQSTKQKLDGLDPQAVLRSLTARPQAVESLATAEKRVVDKNAGLLDKYLSKHIQWLQEPFAADEAKCERAKAIFLKIESDPQKHIALTVPRSGNQELCKSALPNYVSGNHAYSLLEVDSKEKTVLIANPCNSEDTLSMTYDEYFRNFANLIVSHDATDESGPMLNHGKSSGLAHNTAV